jgi:hypothetical protein
MSSTPDTPEHGTGPAGAANPRYATDTDGPNTGATEAGAMDTHAMDIHAMDSHAANTGATSRDQYLAADRIDARTDPRVDRRDVVAAEKERYGGIKIGSAFFGWLTAMGMGVILTALLAAVGTAVGLANTTDAADAAAAASSNAGTIGVVGAIAVAVVLFVAYYCGGYVAGRMARFNGAKQGVAVWVWALLVAIVVAVLGAIAGSEYDVLAQLNSFPRIPVSGDQIGTAGIIALILAALTSLAGAVLGGIAGMRYHRAVDKAGLGH